MRMLLPPKAAQRLSKRRWPKIRSQNFFGRDVCLVGGMPSSRAHPEDSVGRAEKVSNRVWIRALS